MLEYIFGLIAPHLCVACRVEGNILCANCMQTLPSAPACCYTCGQKAERYICRSCASVTPFDELVIVTLYSGPAKRLIHRLKFERAAAAARAMAVLMAWHIETSPQNTIVVHAPTATKRVRVRGYDQSKLLAVQLAKQLGLPYRSLLLRSGQSRQLGTDRRRRKAQMRHAFSMREGALAPSTTVILVDDVLTTGSTLEAAATVLKQAGAQRVLAVVFAVA